MVLISPDELSCPIWENPPERDHNHPSRQPAYLVYGDGNRHYSPRAGGLFRLMPSGAGPLQDLTDRQKANLSYWIYQHNLDNRLFDELPDQVLQEHGRIARWMDDHRDRVLELDKAWVEAHRKRTPSAEDRMLMFLRELVG